MRTIFFTPLFCALLLLNACKTTGDSNYPVNHEPLASNAFIQLPLGSVLPGGWLKDQLIAQKDGLTGHLMDFWPDLMTSSWRGGDGEAWERGPYYLDGLAPLAYLLDDSELKEKVNVWIEYILSSNQENGWFGPEKNTDRWPRAVALKVLKQYYEGSGDERAMELMKNYFTWLADNDPDWPDSEWRGVRAMENAVTGYWLFRHTGDTTILRAIESIQKNCYSWIGYFQTFPWDSTAAKEERIPKIWDAVGLTAHVVNVAMAVKYPGIWSQQSGNSDDLLRSMEGINKLDEHHGQVGGRFSGDEHLSGKNPTQGTEMCAVVEYMFSLENLIEISGDVALADRLEVLAFNSLPGTQSPDGWLHQYDQQSNQVKVSNEKRDWSSNGNESNVFGVEPNFGCCTANGHQGWPKYAQSLWMASSDGGLVAISYAPCRVQALAGNKVPVSVIVNTLYPFNETVSMEVNPEKSTRFPIRLRIPSWCIHPEIQVNGEPVESVPGEYVVIDRKWNQGDRITLNLSAPIQVEKRYRNAVSIKKGPLYYSLRIPKTFTEIDLGKHSHRYLGATDWQIEATGDWNYALLLNTNDPSASVELITMPVSKLPFADAGEMVYDATQQRFVEWTESAPIVMKVKAVKVPSWGMEGNSAGAVPYSPILMNADDQVVTVELVPYASARLRISEFPYTIGDRR